ncbi:MAG: DUF3306 domain-containing protein [Rhizobiales bacterium]|nr:DUF3306 domain-containing protein [Hyphomicrobiales bacterium]
MSRQGGDDEGFLIRWSRLKREPAPAADPATPDVSAATAGTAADVPANALDDLIAALPDIEKLVPGQDISAFMRTGVPLALRNQALRRMWTIDPAIRDFVSEALDYAYDYNVPGGAPGFAAMTANADQVQAVLDGFDRALSALTSESEAKSGATPIAQDNMSQAAPAEAPSLAGHAALQEKRPPAEPASPRADVTASVVPHEPAESLANSGAAAIARDVAMQENRRESKDLEPVRRRHGGALPD